MPQPWKHSRSGWTGQPDPVDVPAQCRGGWTRWPLKVPSNPNSSVTSSWNATCSKTNVQLCLHPIKQPCKWWQKEQGNILPTSVALAPLLFRAICLDTYKSPAFLQSTRSQLQLRMKLSIDPFLLHPNLLENKNTLVADRASISLSFFFFSFFKRQSTEHSLADFFTVKRPGLHIVKTHSSRKNIVRSPTCIIS